MSEFVELKRPDAARLSSTAARAEALRAAMQFATNALQGVL